MKPIAIKYYSVRAQCPDCNGALSVFDHTKEGGEQGWVLQDGAHIFQARTFARIIWRLLKCSGCGRAGLAKFHDNGNGETAVLESFHPRSLSTAAIPYAVLEGIQKEFREAELCGSVEAWRAASAFLRSTLEKVLKASGYAST